MFLLSLLFIGLTLPQKRQDLKKPQSKMICCLCGLLYELCGWGFGERDFKLSLSKVYPNVGSPQLPNMEACTLLDCGYWPVERFLFSVQGWRGNALSVRQTGAFNDTHVHVHLTLWCHAFTHSSCSRLLKSFSPMKSLPSGELPCSYFHPHTHLPASFWWTLDHLWFTVVIAEDLLL